MLYSMKETCNQTNMSYDTLKFYCNEGLIPNVKRDKNNYRVFDEHDIAWIKSLSCLKMCGMSIIEMREYVDLCLQGEKTIPARKIILAKKKEELEQRIEQLNSSIAYIEYKQQLYDDVLNHKIPYISNLKTE